MKKNILILSVLLSSITASAQQMGLKDALGKYFTVGVALSTRVTSDGNAQADELVDRHFNSVVAENCFKGEVVTPREGVYDFNAADSVVRYAEKHHLQLIGHCLIWHSQPPRWMFKNADGSQVSRDELIRRIQNHVRTMVGRYKGKVFGWDVVNEAFEDNGEFRKSPYYNIVGPEYIDIAFRTAQETDPNVELYINDYSLSKPGKRAAVCRLIRHLQQEGIRIDAVGMQSHQGLDYPDLKDYEASIDSFAACGVKVSFTELDINVLPSPQHFNGAGIEQSFEYQKQMNPYANGMPAEVQKKLDKRWLSFFEIYKRHASQIERVTLWGLTDGDSWLNDWPVKGRTNYGLLFDRQYKAKPVVNQIINMFKS
ncbi:MAG: endo-1,4-beta-xylanase [Prevotella sp.]|nr:endo-1,4-beta-xylanase [Prevotella sp.]